MTTETLIEGLMSRLAAVERRLADLERHHHGSAGGGPMAVYQWEEVVNGNAVKVRGERPLNGTLTVCMSSWMQP